MGLLILSRKVDEEIYVTTLDGKLIRIVVTALHGDRVKLGIEAPAEVSIRRAELAERKVA